MGLKNRLSLLKQQAGAATPKPATDTTDPPEEVAGQHRTSAECIPLKERLERMVLRPPKEASGSSCDGDAAQLLGGELVAPGVILVDREVPLSSRHGRQRLEETLHLTAPAFHPGAIDPAGLIFMDTETTGLAGGTGTLAFLVGLARLEPGRLRIRQLFLTGYQGEAAMLRLAAEWFEQGRMMVTFNGKSFDAPLLATRYRMARLRNPLGGLAHLDLVHPTRCAFARIWPDCRLQTAERMLLDFHRNDDLPGAFVPEVWFRFVREGVTRQVPAILEHNRNDLVTLAALMCRLHQAFAATGELPVDPVGIARHHLRQDNIHAAITLLRDRLHALDGEGKLELAGLYRKQKAWPEAVVLWEHMAAKGNIEAMERLAKYHEHVTHDLETALAWASRLIGQQQWNAEHVQREARIRRKLALK